MSGGGIEVGPESHFPIQNLPLGAGSVRGAESVLLMRIGDFAIDCEALRQGGLLGASFVRSLRDLTSLNAAQARALRARVRELLGRGNDRLGPEIVVALEHVEMQLPCRIPAFVDFYSGIHHASNVGQMFRPEMPPLLPNYRHLPVGYNGRASTVVASGSQVSRPSGQFLPAGADSPSFGPTKELDFELEVGFFLADGNDRGSPISVDHAESHMHGMVLVNDWSARDIQRWEYQPLGPFLAKSFATSISPWVVSLEALEPFRVHTTQDPTPLPHLLGTEKMHFDLVLEVSMKTPKMSRSQTISRSNARYLYWSFAQQLAHQTSNGTRVEPGDLYASGTISGPDSGAYGSLLEATWRGTQPITFEETGETRTFLEDGDVVTFSGYGQGDGYRIGFGQLVGEVVS